MRGGDVSRVISVANSVYPKADKTRVNRAVVYMLRNYAGMTPEAISESMRVSRQTVYNLLNKCDVGWLDAECSYIGEIARRSGLPWLPIRHAA